MVTCEPEQVIADRSRRWTFTAQLAIVAWFAERMISLFWG